MARISVFVLYIMLEKIDHMKHLHFTVKFGGPEQKCQLQNEP